MSDQGNFTVLIVDDTATNVMILEKTLVNSGYNVLTADNGKDARVLAEGSKPDLILLDIMMPEEDGFDTIVKLKQNPETASIPVIFLTAVTDVAAKIKGFELGAVDFITKPFHPAEIKARTALHIKLNVATNALIERQKYKLKQIETAQMSMLVQSKDMPDAKFSICFEPLNEAGGDFYDVLKITDTTYSYFVADVSGHDIGTSFVTASVKALLQQNCAPIYTPTESMKMINRVLLGFLPDGKYLTAAYMTLNRKTNKCTILNMGHPPVIYLPANGDILYISSQSDVLGAFQEVFYSACELNVHHGDRFFLYSDGLLEDGSAEKIWTNQKNMEFFSSILPSLKDVALDEAVRRVKDYFYKDDRKPVDDILVMGVEV